MECDSELRADKNPQRVGVLLFKNIAFTHYKEIISILVLSSYLIVKMAVPRGPPLTQL